MTATRQFVLPIIFATNSLLVQFSTPIQKTLALCLALFRFPPTIKQISNSFSAKWTSLYFWFSIVCSCRATDSSGLKTRISQRTWKKSTPFYVLSVIRICLIFKGKTCPKFGHLRYVHNMVYKIIFSKVWSIKNNTNFNSFFLK